MLRTASFSPEENEWLTATYEAARRGLRRANCADPPTIIARRLIDAAKTGERDQARLCALAIKNLRASKLPPRTAS